MITPSPLSTASGAGPQSTGLVPPEVSQKSNDDTHKTPGLCSPKADGSATKTLSMYFVSRCDGLGQSAVNSMRVLGSFAKGRINDVLQSFERCGHLHPLGFLKEIFSSCKHDDLEQQKINAMSFLRSFLADSIDSDQRLPTCGSYTMNPRTFSNLMLSLCESSYQGSFPKKIIGVGSGSAFLEKCFWLMNVMEIKCYDKEPESHEDFFSLLKRLSFQKILKNACQMIAAVVYWFQDILRVF